MSTLNAQIATITPNTLKQAPTIKISQRLQPSGSPSPTRKRAYTTAVCESPPPYSPPINIEPSPKKRLIETSIEEIFVIESPPIDYGSWFEGLHLPIYTGNAVDDGRAAEETLTNEYRIDNEQLETSAIPNTNRSNGKFRPAIRTIQSPGSSRLVPAIRIDTPPKAAHVKIPGIDAKLEDESNVLGAKNYKSHLALFAPTVFVVRNIRMGNIGIDASGQAMDEADIGIEGVFASLIEANECLREIVCKDFCNDLKEQGWGKGWGVKEGGCLYWVEEDVKARESFEEGADSRERAGRACVWVETREM